MRRNWWNGNRVDWGVKWQNLLKAPKWGVEGKRVQLKKAQLHCNYILLLWKFIQIGPTCEQSCARCFLEVNMFLGKKPWKRTARQSWFSGARYKGSSDGRGGGLRGKKRPAELIMGEIIGEASVQIPLQSGLYEGFQDEDFQELQQLCHCHFQELLPSFTWGT